MFLAWVKWLLVPLSQTDVTDKCKIRFGTSLTHAPLYILHACYYIPKVHMIIVTDKRMHMHVVDLEGIFARFVSFRQRMGFSTG